MNPRKKIPITAIFVLRAIFKPITIQNGNARTRISVKSVKVVVAT